MELKSVRGYKAAFELIRGVILVLIPSVFFIIGFLVYLLLTHANTGYESLWILNPKTGNVVNAAQKIGESPDEREAEYYDHVDKFVNNWFAFDQFTFDRNTSRALDLVGNSGKILLNDYKGVDVLRKMQESNMVLSIDVDSIKFDMNSSPVKGAFYIKQTVSKPAGKITRRILGRFIMLDLNQRSIKNPHKALMENIEVDYKKTGIEQVEQTE